MPKSNLAALVLLLTLSIEAAAAAPRLVSDPGTPPVDRQVSLTARQMPLKEALAEVCRAADVELDLDAEGLQQSRLSVDVPVTITLTHEPLQWALARILRELRNPGVFWRAEGARISISTIAAEQERTRRVLPEWLKPLHGNGLVATVDPQHNVIGVSTGGQADDQMLARLKTLPQLRSLHIGPTSTVTPAGLAQLAELPALETLALYEVNREGGGLGDAALRVASRMKSLRDLSAQECGVTDEGLRSLESMTGLTRLALSGNRLTDGGMKSLAGLTKLRALSLSSFPSENDGRAQITEEGLRHLEGLAALEELDLSYLSLAVRRLPFPRLKSLALSGDLVDDAAMPEIARCAELEHLRLLSTQVSDEGLAHAARLKELRRLSLSSHFVTDAGLARLKLLPKLEHIELRASRVTDETLAHLAEIKTLRRLDLHGSGHPGFVQGRIFSMAGLQQLKGLPQLRTLWLTSFAGGGFLALRELTQLRSLVFSMSDISELDADALEAAMPATRIGGLGRR